MIADNMPKHIADTKVFKNLTRAEQNELNRLDAKIKHLLAQYSVQTATTALASYENDLGIPVNELKTVKERRARIVSKIKGQGPCTVQLVKDTSESFGVGEATIEENFAAYTFLIKYEIDDFSVEVNVQDMFAAIQSIKPTHLGFDIWFITRHIIGVISSSDILLFNVGAKGAIAGRYRSGGVFF